MADVLALAEVRLSGHTVGAVTEMDDGAILFEYDPDFRASGLEISPIHLPLSLRGPVRFDDLRPLPAFRGLPGVLADVLPDSFGREVIRSYFTAIGEQRKAFSPVQNLLYVGNRGIGALEFHPPQDVPSRVAEQEALDVAALVKDARRILSGDVDVQIPEIYRLGSSAGGMRPKAVVLFNRERREIRSAFASPREGDIGCILKFDGVGPGGAPGELGPPQPFNPVELAYSRMARDAGLDVVEITPWTSPEGHVHLLIPRFDRTPSGRRHQHTLGGLLHADYNRPGLSSYEEYLRTILRLGMTQDSVVEGYRRMVFNILAVNQDDHVKNLSFHMDSAGAWSLTPAYDVTFARGEGWTARHQMRIAGKQEGIRRDDLLAVAETFGIRAPDRILDRVAEAIASWPECAADAGVPPGTTRAIAADLAARARELEGS